MMEIELANGKHIDHCLERVRGFCRWDPSYKGYDCIDIAQNNRLSDQDILVANKIMARMGALPVSRFKQNRAKIEAALGSVPVGLALDDPWPAEESVWEAIENVYRACWDHDVREARVTKVLHKKRPQLLPIIDGEIVIGYYYAKYSGPRRGVPRMVAVTQRIRDDMMRNVSALRQLQRELLERGIRLTRVRLFDILLWEGYKHPRY